MHPYSGLKFENRVIEGEHHSSNKPEAFNRALRSISAISEKLVFQPLRI